MASLCPDLIAERAPAEGTVGCWARAELSAAVREKSAGRFEGQAQGSLRKPAAESGQAPRSWQPPGGESWDEVFRRAGDFLADVLAPFAEAPGPEEGNPPRILVVSHGGFIKEALNAALGAPPWRANDARNTGIYVLRARPAASGVPRPGAIAGWLFSLAVENDASHLGPTENGPLRSTSSPAQPCIRSRVSPAAVGGAKAPAGALRRPSVPAARALPTLPNGSGPPARRREAPLPPRAPKAASPGAACKALPAGDRLLAGLRRDLVVQAAEIRSLKAAQEVHAARRLQHLAA